MGEAEGRATDTSGRARSVRDLAAPQCLLEEARVLSEAYGNWAFTVTADAGCMDKLQDLQDRWCELAYEELGPLCGMPGKPCQAFELRSQ